MVGFKLLVMKKALIGYGGHAREVAAQIGEEVTFFVDDEYSNDIAKPLSSFNPKKYQAMVAVGDSKVRYDIVKKLPKETTYFTFIHPTTLILDGNIKIGEGSFIGAYSILTTNIKIGKHALLNRGNQIGHDTVIGDYFSAMPGVILSGNVIVYDCVYMGTNSSIREKISVHSLSTIGMNSCVVKNINQPGTYVGVPTKQIK
jgi:sugar O-acyltransferase (sialic acid O-acetyltransferase NeuD family)